MAEHESEWNGAFVSRELGIPQPEQAKGFDRLLGIALRKNKKRAHLLVSTVLGKHIPQNPHIIFYAAEMLAEQIWRYELYPNVNMDVVRRITREKLIAVMDGANPLTLELRGPEHSFSLPSQVTVFGYAETATSLGATVAEQLCAPYIHSTRYPVAGSVEYGGFEEEHSHATAHHITPQNVRMLDNSNVKIVLVDDELTTGNTVMNTIRMFESHTHHHVYYVATLTDLRTQAAVDQFAEFEKEMGVEVHVVSLISAELHVPAGSVEKADPIIERIKNLPEADMFTGRKGQIFVRNYETAPLNLSLGVNDYDMWNMKVQAQNLLDIIAPVTDERVLLLGIEEDMYFSLLVGKELQNRVTDETKIFFSSATRSPVVAYPNPGYAIKDRIKYSVPGEETPRFAYNIGTDFDRIIIITNNKQETERLKDLLEKLTHRTKVVEVLEAKLNVNGLSNPLYGPEFGSYKKEDVTWLLKDLSDVQLEAPTEEREEAIQAGDAHYAESLPVEFTPSDEYQELFFESLEKNKQKLAEAVALVSEQVFTLKKGNPVLVSLARAGTPVGVLMKRYLEKAYNHDVPHYAISIVRDRGIDYNALAYIAAHHNPEDVIFVDGWTGKGAITKELSDALDLYESHTGIRFSPELAVLADPGSCVRIYGTRDDYLIPSACLNSTVSGLVSRTVLNTQLIGENDYHGAKFYAEFAPNDVSNKFIDAVASEFTEKLFTTAREASENHVITEPDWSGWKMVTQVSEEYGINNVNLVKPGVGETTRVLLRRVPWRILVRPQDKAGLKHILLLAEQRGVTVEERADLPYACIGLIHPQGNPDFEKKVS
jgi:pyrimidine operon attenuation protein/uracil phosphoribosyltransferase